MSGMMIELAVVGLHQGREEGGECELVRHDILPVGPVTRLER